jgi:predicted thioredoxin/glutaredoxin
VSLISEVEVRRYQGSLASVICKTGLVRCMWLAAISIIDLETMSQNYSIYIRDNAIYHMIAGFVGKLDFG